MSHNAYRCQFCRKPLSDPKSIAQGVGPECGAKKARVYSAAGITDADLETVAAYDETAARLIRRALGVGGRSDIAWALRKLNRVRADMASIPCPV